MVCSCWRAGTNGTSDVLVCVCVLRGRMFELFSRMAKKPTLTKLDDDGETQMDMCKLRAGAARRVQGAGCGARCAHRCILVIFDLFVLAYVSAGAPQTSTCPATLAQATTGTPLMARPAAAAPTKHGEGSWYGKGWVAASNWEWN